MNSESQSTLSFDLVIDDPALGSVAEASESISFTVTPSESRNLSSDRFENNNLFPEATNLGSLSNWNEENLTIYSGILSGDDAVFVVDISGSAGNNFGGDSVGDLNNHGGADTILDAQIDAFMTLNQELITRGLGNISKVGIVAYSSDATIVDMNPALSGTQQYTTPLADKNNNDILDVNEALSQLVHGGTTNFEAGLSKAIDVVIASGTPIGNGNVIFLSDGVQNSGGSFVDEASDLVNTYGVNLRAFGVGLGSSLEQLQEIDPSAVQFSNTNELLSVFGGVSVDRDIDYFTFSPAVDGNYVIDITFDGSVNDLDLVIYDSLQNEIASSTSDTGDLEQITIALQAGESYFVKVDGDENFYDLGIYLEGSVLVEQTNYNSEYAQAITLDPGTNSLSVSFNDLKFDTSDTGSIPDAFELLLLDADGNTAAIPIAQGHESFFNISEGSAPRLAEGVTYDSITQTVSVDVSHLSEGDQLSLIARLVNTDGLPDDTDTKTQVRIYPEIIQSTESIATASSVPQIEPSYGYLATVDTTRLVDLTTGFDLNYNLSSINAVTNTHHAELTIKNTGRFTIYDQLVIGIRNTTLPITLANADGLTEDGIQYIDLSSRVFDANGNWALHPGEERTVSFELLNPFQDRFDLEVVALGQLNEAPYFTNEPKFIDTAQRLVEAPAGRVFTFDANAFDTDKDQLSFRILNGFGTLDDATGIISWTPATEDIGKLVPIVIEVSDSKGGTDQLEFTLLVTDPSVNRAPYFDTTPKTEAYVNTPYSWTATAFDPDREPQLYYRLPTGASTIPGSEGNDLTINELTGEITWTPSESQVDTTIEVEIEVWDRETGGLSDSLTYFVSVFQEQGNHDPYYVSQPGPDSSPFADTHVVVGDPTPNSDGITVDTNTLTLEAGELGYINVEYHTSTLSPSADIVFVVDESGSMGNSHDWIADIVTQVDSELISAGVTNNRFALIGFSSAQGVRTISDYTGAYSGNKFVPSHEIASYVSNDGLLVDGGEEDGFQGLAHALSDLTSLDAGENVDNVLRADATKSFILISDEGREVDYYNPTNPPHETDYENILYELEQSDIILNSIVWGYFQSDNGSDNQGPFLEGSFDATDTGVLGRWTIDSEAGVYQSEPVGEDTLAISTIEFDATEFPPTAIADRGSYMAISRLGVNQSVPEIAPSEDETDLEPDVFIVIDYHSNTEFHWVGFTSGSKYLKRGFHDTNGFTVEDSLDVSSISSLNIDRFESGKFYELRVEAKNQFQRILNVHLEGINVNLYGSHLSVPQSSERTGIGFNKRTPGVEGSGLFDTFSLLGFEPFNKWRWAAYGMHLYSADFGNPGGSAALGIGANVDNTSIKTGYIANQVDRTGGLEGDFERGSGGKYLQDWHVTFSVNNDETDGPYVRGEIKPYVDLAWARGGSAWDINYLRGDADQLDLQSFSKAFAASQTDIVLDRLTPRFRSQDPVFVAATPVIPDDVGDYYRPTEWVLEFKGDGNPHPQFNLELYQTTDVGVTESLADLPVSIKAPYIYDLKAVDPDSNLPLAYGFAAGSDNYGATIDFNNRLVWDAETHYWNDVPDPANPTSMTYTFELVVTDGRGGVGTQKFTLTLEPPTGSNTSPSIDRTNFSLVDAAQLDGPRSIDGITAKAYRLVEFKIPANDAENAVRYHLVKQSSPTMQIDRNTGLFNWTPGPMHIGDQTFTVQVVDGQGGIDEQAFVLTVADRDRVNFSPILAGNPVNEIEIDKRFEADFSATDIDSDQLNFFLLSAPAGMAIDRVTGQVLWEPGIDQIGEHTYVVAVVDSNGATDSESYQVSVTAPPLNPIVLVDPFAVLSATVDNQFFYPIEVVDPDSAIAPAFIEELSNVPNNYALNGPSGPGFYWTPDSSYQVGDTIDIELVFHDGDHLSGGHNLQHTTSHSFSIDIIDGANDAPILTNSPRLEVGVGQAFNYTPKFKDLNGDSVTVTFPVLPSWITLSSEVERLYQGTPDEQSLGLVHPITVRLDDGRGGITEETFEIDVVGQPTNSSPTIVNPELTDQEASGLPDAVVGELYRLDMQSSSENEDALIWTMEAGPNDPTLYFDPEKGLLLWTPREEHLGIHDVTFVTMDPFGGEHRVNYTLQVKGANTPAQLDHQKVPLQVATGTAFDFSVGVSDPDALPGDITYAFWNSSKPDWMSVDPLTGMIEGIAGPTGNYAIELAITDTRLPAGAITPTDVTTIDFVVVDPNEIFYENLTLLHRPSDRLFRDQTLNFTPSVFDPNGFGGATWSLNQESLDLGMTRVEDSIEWIPTLVHSDKVHFLSLDLTSSANPSFTTRYRAPIYVDGSRTTNTAPTIDVTAFNDLLTLASVVPGQTFRVAVPVSDVDGDNPIFSIEPNPHGIKVDANGRITWEIPENQATGVGVDVTIKVQDKFRAESSYTFTLTPAADTEGPTVSLLTSQTLISLDGILEIRTNTFDNVGIDDQWITITDQHSNTTKIGVSTQGVAAYQMDTAGTFEFRLHAIDTAGNTSDSDSVEVNVFDPTSLNLTASLSGISEGIITDATSLSFDVNDSNSPGLELQWQIDLISGQNNQIISVQSGVGRVTGGTASIDPFSVPDGAYTVRLLASLVDTTSVDNKVIAWEGDTLDITIDTNDYKIGEFSSSFTDLTLNAGGVPLQFTRSYSSSDISTANDFGPGWTFDLLSKVKLGFGYSHDRAESPSGIQSYHQPSTWLHGKELYLTMPGGRTEGFRLVREYWSNARKVRFEPIGNTTSQLLFSGPYTGGANRISNSINVRFGDHTYAIERESIWASDVLLQNDGSGTPFSPLLENNLPFYTPKGKFLALKTADGHHFIFDGATREIVYIVAPDGSTMHIRAGKNVTSYDAEGNLVGSASITRDAQGRVSSIQLLDDPFSTPQFGSNGNLLNGQQVSYKYDANGDLVEVISTDDSSTKLEYNVNEVDDGNGGVTDQEIGHPHFLTRITDATGVRTFEASFNGAGQFSGIIDAEGSNASVTHKPGPDGTNLKIDVAVDSFGNSTEIARDTRGNIVRALVRTEDQSDGVASNDLYQVTVTEYDSAGRLIGQSHSFQRTYEYAYSSQADIDLITNADVKALQGDEPNSSDPANLLHWQSRTEYDDRGNVVMQQDTLGNVTRMLNYTYFSQPTVVIDPSGSRTESEFNDQGRLLRTVTKAVDGTVTSDTRYEYDERFGSVTRVVRIDQNGTEIESGSTVYDDQGRPIRSTDADGNTQYTVYDSEGQPVLSFSYWDQPDNSGKGDGTFDMLSVSRTDYDEAGRSIRSRSYTFDRTQTNHTSFFSFDSEGISTLTDPSTLNQHLPDWETSSEYDSAGRMLSSTDRYGRVSTTHYNRRGQVVETRTSVKDETRTDLIRVSRTVYDSNGRTVANSDPFLIDTAGTLVTPIADLRLSYTVYDSAGRAIEQKRLAGAVAEISITNSTASFSSTSFNETFAKTAVEGDTGFLSSTKTEYDQQGRVFRTISATGVSSYPQYDHAGRQVGTITTADLNGDDTLDVTSNANGVPTSGPEFIHTESKLDANGRQIQSIDPLGQTMEYIYDSQGRLIQTVYDDFTVTKTEYDYLGNRVAEINQLGERRSFEYDSEGRQIAVLLPAITIDDPQNLGSSITVNPRYEYTYDQYGNHTTITTNAYQKADGSVIYLRKNSDNVDVVAGSRLANEAPTAAMLAAATTTFLSYDHRGRQISRTLPDGLVETTHFNDSNLTNIAGELNESVGLGQLEYMVDFEGRVTAYRYDNTSLGSGRRIGTFYYQDINVYLADRDLDGANSLDHADEKILVKHDAYGRVITEEFHRADNTIDTTNTVFDAEGRVTQISKPEGVLNYEYDDLGRQKSVATGDFMSPTTKTEYSYDELGRLETVVGAWQEGIDIPDEITTYRYDAAGRLNHLIRSNGVVTDYVYDDLGRLDVLTDFVDTNRNETLDAGESVLAEYDYEIRADGKRSGVLETDDQGRITQIDWVYDELGRLSQERYDSYDDAEDYTTNYLYDLASNRVGKLTDHGSDGTLDERRTLLYDANDRIISEQLDDLTAADEDTFTVYEHAGTKQTKKTIYTGLDDDLSDEDYKKSETIYEYNLQGRLGKVTAREYNDTGILIAQTDTSLKYDSTGVRTRETDLGTGDMREYLIDSNNKTGYAKAIEERLNSDFARSYTIGSTVLAQADVGQSSRILLTDGHGSTRLILDPAAAILETYRYTADGLPIGFDPNIASTSLLFGGDSQYNPTLELYYHLARWREANGWLTLDPYFGDLSDPLSLNKYLFVHGDSVNGWDPTGMWVTLMQDIAIGAGMSLAGSIYFGSLYKELGQDENEGSLTGAMLGASLYTSYRVKGIYSGLIVPVASGLLTAILANMAAPLALKLVHGRDIRETVRSDEYIASVTKTFASTTIALASTNAYFGLKRPPVIFDGLAARSSSGIAFNFAVSFGSKLPGVMSGKTTMNDAFAVAAMDAITVGSVGLAKGLSWGAILGQLVFRYGRGEAAEQAVNIMLYTFKVLYDIGWGNVIKGLTNGFDLLGSLKGNE